MSSFPAHPEQSPSLRIVYPDAGPDLETLAARRGVAAENRRAAGLAARGNAHAESDVRRIFAMRAGQALEGGRAAILRPESRRRLVSEARRAGLRAFEANLIIAIVQDAARRGEASGPAGLIEMIPHPARREERQLLVQRVVVALLLAAGAMAMLIRWVAGG